MNEEKMRSQWSILNSGKNVPRFPECLLGKGGRKGGNSPCKILLAYAWYPITMPKRWFITLTFNIRNLLVINLWWFKAKRGKDIILKLFLLGLGIWSVIWHKCELALCDILHFGEVKIYLGDPFISVWRSYFILWIAEEYSRVSEYVDYYN